MTLNLAKVYQRKNPDARMVYACHPSIRERLEPTIKAMGFEAVIGSELIPTLNPKAVKNLVGYPLAEGYPEKPMQKHLIEYFAAELGVEPDFEGFELPMPERKIPAKYFTIHTTPGWSVYKGWFHARWQELTKRIFFKYGIQPVQIGGPNDVPLEAGWVKSYLGKSFQENLEVMAHAEFHIGIDSWSNHATNIRWGGKKTRGLILWGSTQPEAAGYKHNLNLQYGSTCQPCFREDPKISRQPRGECPWGGSYADPCHPCMVKLTLERVWQECEDMIEGAWGIRKIHQSKK